MAFFFPLLRALFVFLLFRSVVRHPKFKRSGRGSGITVLLFHPNLSASVSPCFLPKIAIFIPYFSLSFAIRETTNFDGSTALLDGKFIWRWRYLEIKFRQLPTAEFCVVQTPLGEVHSKNINLQMSNYTFLLKLGVVRDLPKMKFDVMSSEIFGVKNGIIFFLHICFQAWTFKFFSFRHFHSFMIEKEKMHGWCFDSQKSHEYDGSFWPSILTALFAFLLFRFIVRRAKFSTSGRTRGLAVLLFNPNLSASVSQCSLPDIAIFISYFPVSFAIPEVANSEGYTASPQV